MIIDTHIHVWSYPALADARDHIKSTKDLVSFRSRCPDLYDRTLTEDPIDNSDQLIADMDAFGIDKAFVQARPGSVTNDQVALSVTVSMALCGLAMIRKQPTNIWKTPPLFGMGPLIM